MGGSDVRVMRLYQGTRMNVKCMFGRLGRSTRLGKVTGFCRVLKNYTSALSPCDETKHISQNSGLTSLLSKNPERHLGHYNSIVSFSINSPPEQSNMANILSVAGR